MTTTAEQIKEIIMDCLYMDEEITEGETPKDAVMVKGIVRNFGFHPGRLESHREEVKAILNQMKPEFHANQGGGWSFLNLCEDKDGNLWAEHPTMEELIVLAMGLGMARYCLPREAWEVLPGGVPYIVFDTEGKSKEETQNADREEENPIHY